MTDKSPLKPGGSESAGRLMNGMSLVAFLLLVVLAGLVVYLLASLIHPEKF